MKRVVMAVLVLAVGLAGIAGMVLFSGAGQDEAPDTPEDPVSVENTREPGAVLEEWDDERRQNAEPN